MKLLDLFAGIGGFSLAAHWMGWETAAFVERDKFCQQVLRKNFGQDIEIHDDITTFSGMAFRGRIDILTGGFPCQDISIATNRRGGGLAGKRSGLFFEMVRVIADVRPTWIVGENVGSGTTEWVDVVQDALETENYSVQPFHIEPSAVGGFQSRNRIWIVAHSNAESERLHSNASVLKRIDTTQHVRQQRPFSQLLDDLKSRGETDQRGFVFPDGLSARVGRLEPKTMDAFCLRGYGNAIDPRIAFEIFKAIDTLGNPSNAAPNIPLKTE